MRTKVSKHAAQSQETRRKILEAATHVFIEKGFEATTIKQITDRAGIAYSTSYVYFENKGVIFTYVVDETIKNLYSMARHPFFPGSVQEAYDTICIQSGQYLEIGQIHRGMMQVIQQAIHSSELIRDKWDQVRQYFIGTITQDITYAQNVGLVRVGVNPRIVAPSWQASNEWYLWKIVQDKAEFSITDIAKTLTETYVRSIYNIPAGLVFS